jgi:hypothetical protein
VLQAVTIVLYTKWYVRGYFSAYVVIAAISLVSFTAREAFAGFLLGSVTNTIFLLLPLPLPRRSTASSLLLSFGHSLTHLLRRYLRLRTRLFARILCLLELISQLCPLLHLPRTVLVIRRPYQPLLLERLLLGREPIVLSLGFAKELRVLFVPGDSGLKGFDLTDVLQGR